MEIYCNSCGKIVSFSGYKPSKCQFCGADLTEESVQHKRSEHSSYTVPDFSSSFSSPSSDPSPSFSDVSSGSSSSSDFSSGGGDSGGGGSSDSF